MDQTQVEHSEDESLHLSDSEDETEIKDEVNKKRKRRLSNELETERLDHLLFGNKKLLLANLEKAAGVDEFKQEVSSARKPAWQDSDDDEIDISKVVEDNQKRGPHIVRKEGNYKAHLKNQFDRLLGTPAWADLDKQKEVDSDEEILQSVGHLVKPNVDGKLPENLLGYKKLKDLNRATYSEGSITSIEFHPTSTVALVTGLKGIATIYSIDGKKNDKLHSIEFKNFPIRCARMNQDGEEAIIGGSKNFFYTYNLMTGQSERIFLDKSMYRMTKFEKSKCGKYLAVIGRFGEIHILHQKSKELLFTAKQEHQCSSVSFSPDSGKLYAHSNNSEVSIFDIRTQKLSHKFIDDGCIAGKTISISPCGNLLATGSAEGVVNLYNATEVMKSAAPQPMKAIYNLTTEISDAGFNASSEILAMCSDNIAESVKMVHLPSGSVFSNFPGFQTKIGRAKVLSFSPQSGYFAIGNASKEVAFYRLKHFSNY